MERWCKFVDSITGAMEKQGGEMLFLYCVMITGAVMNHYGVPKSEDIIVFSLGIMGRAMGAQGK